MIKFFRKIRQNLVSENKFSKYLIYAIGEIILVVVGILIAVQLNNQNEIRKQKLVEIDILEGIRSDILKDTVDLNFNINIYKNGIELDSLLLNHLLIKKEKTNAFVKSLNWTITSDWIIVLHDSHFQEAKLKGLSIISNDSLRDEINRLYEFQYKALLKLENDSESFDHNTLLRNEIGQYFGYDSTGVMMIETAYNKLLSNSNSLYYIEEGMFMKSKLLEFHENTLETALKIEDDIKEEINSLKD